MGLDCQDSGVQGLGEEGDDGVRVTENVLRGSIGILNEVGYGATVVPRVDLGVVEVRKRGRQEDEDLRIELAFVYFQGPYSRAEVGEEMSYMVGVKFPEVPVQNPEGGHVVEAQQSQGTEVMYCWTLAL